jgi:hypothetical protein
MALLLLLPLPIPFTNVLPALPIVLITLGMMERDGAFIAAGYLGGFFTLGVFVVLYEVVHQLVLVLWRRWFN